MAENDLMIPVEELHEFILETLETMGVPSEDAKIVTEVILTSDLWGIRSHGIAHLRMYNEREKKGLMSFTTDWTIVKDTPTTAVIDGGNGMGMVVGHHAMNLAIQKAKEFGLGAVAVRNSSHYGIAGYYSMMAVKAGMVGLSFTNAHPSTAPTFGVKAMLGTNPIAVGVPTDEEFPFLFDASTSVIPRGKIEVAARANKTLQEGWMINDEGVPVTNSQNLIAGMKEGTIALLPVGGMGETLGGHKGYGLSTMVEIFSAAFQDGTYLWGLTDEDEEGHPQFLRIGHFFMAIDVEHFVPLEVFKRISGNIVRDLRNSPRMPDQPRIFTAGEKEHDHSLKALEEGIPIAPGVQKALASLRDELKLPRGLPGL